jgi:hypothetical protein
MLLGGYGIRFGGVYLGVRKGGRIRLGSSQHVISAVYVDAKRGLLEASHDLTGHNVSVSRQSTTTSRGGHPRL